MGLINAAGFQERQRSFRFHNTARGNVNENTKKKACTEVTAPVNRRQSVTQPSTKLMHNG